MATLVIVHKHWWTVFSVKLLDVCTDTLLVWNREEWYRVFVAPLYHANDYHIFFCLVSFLIKVHAHNLSTLVGAFHALLVTYTAVGHMILVPGPT